MVCLSMSRKYKFSDQDKLYFISFATVHWIDVFVISYWHKRTLAPTEEDVGVNQDLNIIF